MALAPKPVTLTSGANPSPGNDPEPLVVVSGATAGSVGVVTKQAAIANQAAAGTLADLAAAQTAINAVTTKLNAVLAALRAAGIIVP